MTSTLRRKLFLLLVLAHILLDFDKAGHGELDGAHKGVDHVHVRHRLDQLLLPARDVSLAGQQFNSLQQWQTGSLLSYANLAGAEYF